MERKSTETAQWRADTDVWVLEGNLVLQGVSTLRKAVLGEKQNSPRNLKILPGIKRLGKFSGRQEVLKLKFQEVWDFFGNVSQKLFCSNSDCKSCHPPFALFFCSPECYVTSLILYMIAFTTAHMPITNPLLFKKISRIYALDSVHKKFDVWIDVDLLPFYQTSWVGLLVRYCWPEYKSANPNWFICRTFHVLNSNIKFGTYEKFDVWTKP